VGTALLDYTVNDVVAHRQANRDPSAVPHGCYRCADGDWCTISCWDQEEWQRLCAHAHAGWECDARFATAESRRQHEDALDAAIGAWTTTHPASDLAAGLQRARVHAGVVNDVDDLFDDPQLAERDLWQPFDHDELGTLRYRMVSYQLSETPGRVRSAAPRLGEHNEQVFRDWMGLSADEYRRLEARGVFS
jgi:benzylsuccinate CoA-transferase BbsF subunit